MVGFGLKGHFEQIANPKNELTDKPYYTGIVSQ